MSITAVCVVFLIKCIKLNYTTLQESKELELEKVPLLKSLGELIVSTQPPEIQCYLLGQNITLRHDFVTRLCEARTMKTFLCN